MKIQCLPIRIFEHGDFVRTPNGVGKVILERSSYHPVQGYFEYSEVRVVHKTVWSGGPSDKTEWIDAENVLLISKKEYEEAEF